MATTPLPGDWAVVNTGGHTSAVIQFAEYVADAASGMRNPKVSQWDHAVVCQDVEMDGTIWIVEAEPGGARSVAWHYQDRPHQWSTGILPNVPTMGAAAYRYACPGPWGPHGVPYSDLDYVAIALHSLHVPAPYLRTYISNSEHMICSQLVDQAAQDAGEHLFTDGRWPGYVKPSDLGLLLQDPHSYGWGSLADT